MARMYPNQLSSSTRSKAERQLYEAFRNNLEDDYLVFHSAAWLSPDTKGRPRDGEADFVIAHPQRGVLIMEAKGGIICYDSQADRWTSTDRSNWPHRIKDPFAQALKSKYALQYRLKALLDESWRCINFGHAAAFPEVVLREGSWLGLDKPRQIILDATDLADLPSWVDQAMTYWRGPEPVTEANCGEKIIKALIELLAKDWELRPALWGDFVQEKDQLIRLTRQQYLVLDVLNRQRRAAICGCAGSGKTMLAAEKASRLARQGFRVLLTCFNKNLAADLREHLKPSANLDICNFHALCYDLAKQAGVLPVKQYEDTFFGQQLPEALTKAVKTLDIRFDAIVVDEGQDFRDGWWFPLQMLLRDPDEGILYIFFDDNQRIYVSQSEVPISQSPYVLTRNCRNTQNIHRLVVQFYASDTQPTTQGPHGRQVEEIFYSDARRMWPALQSVLNRLVEDEHIPADKIAVLTTTARTKTNLLDSSISSGLKLADTLPLRAGQIFCTTIHDFKGLERAVIILVGVGQRLSQEDHDLNSLLYVGCSRARHHLIVLMPENADRRVRKAFVAARTKTITGS